MPSSEKKQFRNLVFEGGGVLGIAYAGALRVVEGQGIMDDIQRVAGASAGAITAALLALGYSADGIKDVVAGTSFESFMDDPGGFFVSLARSLSKYGWFAGDSFSEWMKDKVKRQGFPEGLTFAQLEEHALQNPKKFRKLYVVSSNLTKGTVIQFDANETPDVPVWRAVRASMSIPFFFASMRQADKPDPDAAMTDALGRALVLVDGGVTWNYPIDIFDDLRFIEEKDEKNKPARKFYALPGEVHLKTQYDDGHVYNKQTLGFRVDSDDEIAEYKNREAAKARSIGNIVQYSAVLIQFMRGLANRSHLKTHDWHRTVFLDDGGIPFTDFELSQDAIRKLLENGKTGGESYFKWFNDPKYDKPAPEGTPEDPSRPVNKVY